MQITDGKIEAVVQVLCAWNPLGTRAKDYKDLNNYRTEASDILVELTSEKAASKIVQVVISEAFGVDLSIHDCQEPAKEIWRIYMQQNR